MRRLHAITVWAAMSVVPVAGAHVFAAHESVNAEGTFTLTSLFGETSLCAKRQGVWKDAMFRITFRTGYVKTLPACWRPMTAADAAKMHVTLNGDVVMICPLPNNFVGTSCSYILKDEFVDPSSLPRAAFPNQ